MNRTAAASKDVSFANETSRLRNWGEKLISDHVSCYGYEQIIDSGVEYHRLRRMLACTSGFERGTKGSYEGLRDKELKMASDLDTKGWTILSTNIFETMKRDEIEYLEYTLNKIQLRSGRSTRVDFTFANIIKSIIHKHTKDN